MTKPQEEKIKEKLFGEILLKAREEYFESQNPHLIVSVDAVRKIMFPPPPSQT